MFEAIEQINPKLKPLFTILINAGYRLGEVLALQNDREMINFEAGYMRVPRIIRKDRKKRRGHAFKFRFNRSPRKRNANP